MKYYPGDIFVNKKLHEARSVLLFGPEEGVKVFLADTLKKLWQRQGLTLKTINQTDLKKGNVTLMSGPSLFGGEEAYVIHGVTNTLAKDDTITGPMAPRSILVAGSLKTTDALTKLYVGNNQFAAVGCYENDTKFLQAFLMHGLKKPWNKTLVAQYVLQQTTNLHIIRSLLKLLNELPDDCIMPQVQTFIDEYLASDVDTNFFNFVYQHLGSNTAPRKLGKFESYFHTQGIQALRQLKYLFMGLLKKKLGVKQKGLFVPFAYAKRVDSYLGATSIEKLNQQLTLLDQAEAHIKTTLQKVPGQVVAQAVVSVLG